MYKQSEKIAMNIESKTSIKSYRTIHMGFGTSVSFKDIETTLSKTMTDKLVKYALERLDEDLRNLVISKNYKVVVNRTINREKEKLNDSDYQVDFISKSGLMISVDYILINSKNNPFLDHGVSLAEGQ